MVPTDSRLRPDRRIMEEEDFEGVNKEKVRREEGGSEEERGGERRREKGGQRKK